ncbi:MAG: CocE/NonD family hydrolase, partial [Acidimicrobiia bacterium]
MRDGVLLAADIWRPRTETPVAVLVARSPYN